jgi:hypothetical protein
LEEMREGERTLFCQKVPRLRPFVLLIHIVRVARLYRVIQEGLPTRTELISDGILSKKCHMNLGPIHNIYRVTFVFGNTLL